MQLFIKHFIRFFLLLIILFASLIAALDLHTQNRFSFKIKKDPEYIVIGNSHPECAINDKLIKGFKNLSRSGESYFYTYVKLKEILKVNPKIKTVFVDFSNSQLIQKTDTWIWDDQHLSRYCIFKPFMSWDEKQVLYKNNFKGFLNVYSLSAKKCFDYTLSRSWNKINELGAYSKLTRELNDSLKKYHLKQYVMSDFRGGVAKYNIDYLDKIISLCRKENKNVVFLRTPMHRLYPGKLNEKDLMKLYKEKYSDVLFLDFEKFELSDSEFADLEHLNEKGAYKFSNFFDTVIKRDSLSGYYNEIN